MTQGELFGMTLAAAQSEFRVKARGKGGLCPCCGKFGKVYRRKFNSGMARVLLYMYPQAKRNPKAWVNIRDFLIEIGQTRLNNYGVLLHWDMLERRVIEADNGARATGEYRITPIGFEFCELRARVHSHVLEYNGEFERYDGDLINIEQALGKHFDYRELMRETAGPLEVVK